MLELSTTRKTSDGRHWSAVINQLYHPTGEFGQDWSDLVYSFGNLNTTKFAPILLKEWFYMVKPDGYLVIDYQPNSVFSWQTLEETMWWLWKSLYEIIYHGPVEGGRIVDLNERRIRAFITFYESRNNKKTDHQSLVPESVATVVQPCEKKGGYFRFICRKTKATQIRNDAIEKWSFGVITNVLRPDCVEKTIESVRKLGVPHYEIIVCGTHFDRHEQDVRYIPFDQRDDVGWISKKKNLIVSCAQYENICIIHDRIEFDIAWYDQMKKWGNCFEALSVPQILRRDKKRFGDWCCLDKKYFDKDRHRFLFAYYMDYKDWDPHTVGFAGATMVKRTLLENIPFDETLYWGQYEDLKISQNFMESGYLLRMNPGPILYSNSKTHADFGWFVQFNETKRGRLRANEVDLSILSLFKFLNCLWIRKNNRLLVPLKTHSKRIHRILTHENRNV